MSEAVPIAEAFLFCPKCGRQAARTGVNPFRCSDCGYSHFFSPCSAVAAIIRDTDRQVLFLTRERDPGKGMLGLPGGFVDVGESLEEALKREILEEVGLTTARMQYLISYPNSYNWKGVILPVTDTFFVCDVDHFEITTQESEVSSWNFAVPNRSTLDRMAFPSNRKAIEYLLNSEL
ncbi:MAG: NUDIX domain-containing protein [Planctomycetaceae bacterium]